jgi:hypothetical protein
MDNRTSEGQNMLFCIWRAIAVDFYVISYQLLIITGSK